MSERIKPPYDLRPTTPDLSAKFREKVLNASREELQKMVLFLGARLKKLESELDLVQREARERGWENDRWGL